MISQKRALELGIKALQEIRRRRYASGEEAFKQGVDFTFAIDGHRHYTEYTEAIQQLDDLIEILQAPMATVDPEPNLSTLPLFAEMESA